jgi:hypothetical protein
MESVTSGGAKSKTRGVIEGAKDALGSGGRGEAAKPLAPTALGSRAQEET